MLVLPTALVRQIEESPWFYRADSPYAVVDTSFRFCAVNLAYARATGHSGSALVGERVFEVFPDNPSDPCANGVAKLSASLESVFSDGRRHWMGVQRYDVPVPGRPGRFVYKVWAPDNSPIRLHGRVAAALHHVEDVTGVLSPDANAVPWQGIRESASELCRLFPGLPYEAVIGTLTDSHGVVMEVAGRPDPERARELATVRLELLAGHPRMGQRVSSHLRPQESA